MIVANTSPLTNLAATRQFELLAKLYGRLHIAEAVWQEVNADGKSHPGREEVAAADWVERHKVNNLSLVQALQRDLDPGESETITLAVELSADVTLLDEREGRHAAKRLGVRTLGVVGILLDAKTHNYIRTVKPHLDALRTVAGFYLRDTVYEQVLAIAAELN